MVNRLHCLSSSRGHLEGATRATIVPMTVGMIPEVTKVHLDSFGGYMSSRMGNIYVRKFMTWFCTADGSIALVAIDSDTKVQGYAIGAPLGYDRSMNRDLIWIAAAGISIRPWLLFDRQFRSTLVNRLRLILGCSVAAHADPKLPEPTMSLVGIGVLPSARGKKIGLHLMQAFEAKAREVQMRSLRLSVYPDNTAARGLYETCGWQQFPVLVREEGAVGYFRIL